VYNFNVPTFGKGVVYDVDQKVRTEQFRFFTEALKKDRLKKYVPMFAAEAEVRGARGARTAAAHGLAADGVDTWRGGTIKTGHPAQHGCADRGVN
jgi:hypothetical protein